MAAPEWEAYKISSSFSELTEVRHIVQPIHACRGLSRQQLRSWKPGAVSSKIRTLLDADKDENIVGVFRSQMGFPPERAAAPRAFAESLVKNKVRYDLRGLFKYEEKKTKHEEELQELLERRLRQGRIQGSARANAIFLFCAGRSLLHRRGRYLRHRPTSTIEPTPSPRPTSTKSRPSAGFSGTSNPTTKLSRPDDPLMNMTSLEGHTGGSVTAGRVPKRGAAVADRG